MSISVSTLVRYLKNRLDSDDRLQNVTVTGELSNFHKHTSGHLYFTLKDEHSSLSCVMFASKASTLKFDPKNGDKVDVTGNVSLFETTGQLQLYVSSMKLAGLGDLYKQYEILKNKLLEEGYFNDDHKISLPTSYPNKVAVLVGNNSAAMSDIKTCFLRRWPLAQVDYYPVLVQGKDAPQNIIENLKIVDNLDYEIIILARGGGSFEDLFCFNDENLVKTIFNLKTFIITGIGHEQDFTLADFVADLRAPTPTASVELITKDIKDVIIDISDLEFKMNNTIRNSIDNYKMKLDYYSTKVDNYSNHLESLNSYIEKVNLKIMNSVNLRISNIKNSISNFDNISINLINKNILIKKKELESLNNLIKAYSIENTLKRGYSLVYKDSKLVRNKDKIKVDDDIDVRLYGGSIKAKVKEI